MEKKKIRILVAEDTLGWQKFHSSMLKNYENADLDFVITDCARDALQLAWENLEKPFDIIITDLQMENDFHPKFAGEWFVEELKQLQAYNNKPIIIVSATYNIEFVAQSLGVDFISKRSLVNNPDVYYLKLDEYLI